MSKIFLTHSPSLTCSSIVYMPLLLLPYSYIEIELAVQPSSFIMTTFSSSIYLYLPECTTYHPSSSMLTNGFCVYEQHIFTHSSLRLHHRGRAATALQSTAGTKDRCRFIFPKLKKATRDSSTLALEHLQVGGTITPYNIVFTPLLCILCIIPLRSGIYHMLLELIRCHHSLSFIFFLW